MTSSYLSHYVDLIYKKLKLGWFCQTLYHQKLPYVCVHLSREPSLGTSLKSINDNSLWRFWPHVSFSASWSIKMGITYQIPNQQYFWKVRKLQPFPVLTIKPNDKKWTNFFQLQDGKEQYTKETIQKIHAVWSFKDQVLNIPETNNT